MSDWNRQKLLRYKVQRRRTHNKAGVRRCLAPLLIRVGTNVSLNVIIAIKDEKFYSLRASSLWSNYRLSYFIVSANHSLTQVR